MRMDSVIALAGCDEPTQLNADGTVSTGVNMGVWHGADTVPVQRPATAIWCRSRMEFTRLRAGPGERGGKTEVRGRSACEWRSRTMTTIATIDDERDDDGRAGQEGEGEEEEMSESSWPG